MTKDWDWEDEIADVTPLKNKKRVVADKTKASSVKEGALSPSQQQTRASNRTKADDFDAVDDFDDMIQEAHKLTESLFTENVSKDSKKEVKPLQIDAESFFKGSEKEDYATFAQTQQNLKERYKEFILKSHTSDLIYGHLPSLDNKILKKLRQGQFPIQGRIDLHGLTLEQAYNQSMSFLHARHAQGARVVLITHGKGKGYGHLNDMGIIKSQIHQWLMGHTQVLAFHTALPKHGGAGALYVLLKKNRTGS